MTIEAIAAAASAPADFIAPTEPASGAAATNFDALVQSFEALNTRMQAGQAATTQMALGQADNLHQIMIDGEQTRLTFELMLAVRNKVLEAYQELMRMQV